MGEYRGTMFRHIIFSLVVICALVCQSSACNRKCVSKDETKQSNRNEKDLMHKLVELVDIICNLEENGGYCNHTVLLPGGIFQEGSSNITFRYSGIVLDEINTDSKEEGNGTLSLSLSLSYSNLTVFFDRDGQRLVLDVSENRFNLPLNFNVQKTIAEDVDCYFEWGRIRVDKFEFSVPPDGLPSWSQGVVDKFRIDNLRDVVNGESFMDYLDREVSFCNDKSFLHDLISAYIMKEVFGGVMNALGKLLNGQCE